MLSPTGSGSLDFKIVEGLLDTVTSQVPYYWSHDVTKKLQQHKHTPEVQVR